MYADFFFHFSDKRLFGGLSVIDESSRQCIAERRILSLDDDYSLILGHENSIYGQTWSYMLIAIIFRQSFVGFDALQVCYHLSGDQCLQSFDVAYMEHVPDSRRFDVFGYLDIAHRIFYFFEDARGPWVSADDRIESWKVFDDVIFPVFVAFHIRQRIDGEFHSNCVQYFRYHHFPFFVAERIFGSMFLIGRSDSDEKFSYSIFSRLFKRVYMSEMERLEATDKQPYFLFHRKILGIKRYEYSHSLLVFNNKKTGLPAYGRTEMNMPRRTAGYHWAIFVRLKYFISENRAWGTRTPDARLWRSPLYLWAKALCFLFVQK